MREASMQRTARFVVIGAVIVAFAIGIATWPYLPEQMPTHWNAAGEVDGYSSRAFGAFFFPAMMAGLGLLLWFLPRIDPLKKNIQKFRAEYEVFIAVFEVFFLMMYVVTILTALGVDVSMNVAVSLGTGVLFIAVAWMIGRAKRNFFIGIRTPWTLMSDEVWARTHALGSKLFYAAGVIAMLGAIFPDYAIWFILVPSLVAALGTYVYSYVIYQRLVPSDDAGGPPPASS
jgi:uncharacterized membrane protein